MSPPLRGRGWGELNSDEGTDTLLLYVNYNPSKNWAIPDGLSADVLGLEGDKLACGGGDGGDPIPTMGQTLWYSILWYYYEYMSNPSKRWAIPDGLSADDF
jgi:hypothetical protein